MLGSRVHPRDHPVPLHAVGWVPVHPWISGPPVGNGVGMGQIVTYDVPQDRYLPPSKKCKTLLYIWMNLKGKTLGCSSIQKPPGGTLGIRTLCATTPFPFLSPSMFTIARSLRSAVSRTGNYAICSLICTPDVSYFLFARACRSLIARNTSLWLPFLPCHSVPLSLWLQMQDGEVKAHFADSLLLFLTKLIRRLHQHQHQPCIWLALGLTHARHHYHSHSCSSGIIGLFAIPSLPLHLAGAVAAATWFVFLFYFPLSFADRFFLIYSHLLQLVPLLSPCHMPPFVMRCLRPRPVVSPLPHRPSHASPLSHRAFIMCCLFRVALCMLHRHVATLVRACRVMLSHAPSPHVLRLFRAVNGSVCQWNEVDRGYHTRSSVWGRVKGGSGV